MTPEPFTYCTCCVECGDKDIPALQRMQEDAREVTWAQFRRQVAAREIRPLFTGYAWGPGVRGLRMPQDFAVSFYRSTWYGRPCLFVRWSLIEFIFTKGGRW